MAEPTEYDDPNAPEDAGKSADQKIITAARDALKACIDEEEQERGKMLDDLKFCTLDQWPSEVRKEREDTTQEGGARSCLTVDKINPFIVQVVNDMRQGKPGINIRPQDDNADIETAKILKGLVRNIEDQSNADIAYSTGGESAVRMGLGFWRITTEYVSEDSFDQEIFIRAIPNTFSTYLGKHIVPDGSDAKEGFIVEVMPVDTFKAQNPGKKCAPDDFDDVGDVAGYWHTGETITVIERYWLERVNTKMLYLADGTTMSRADYDKWPASAGAKPGILDERDSWSEQLKWVKMTGIQVLDKRDLPGKYIPIVEIVGREAWLEGRRLLWGLVRPAKDSLRMYNYWSSTITDKMALAPRSPWVAAEGQIAGREAEWRDSNKKSQAVLQYKPIDVNGNALPPPQRQGAMPIEAAMTGHLQVISEDVRGSLGVYKAGLGESESQQSGRAILALQKESDTGTYHFGANQGISIRHTGRIIVDMIPHYYDTKRVVRILGDDGEVNTVTLDPNQQQAHAKVQTDTGIKSIYNPGVGKYDVAITVGPSYNTKRMEDQALFVEMAKGAADPISAAVLRYLTMRNSDTPGAQEAAKMLKALLPPQVLQALGTNQPIPPEAQAMLAKMQQQMAMMQEQGQKMQEENVALKAKQQEGMAKVQVDAQEGQAKLQLQAQQTQAELALQKQKQDGEIELARQKAEAEIAIKRAVAEADHQTKIAGMEIERQHKEKEMSMEHEHKKKEADFNMAIKARDGMPPELAAQAYKQDLMQNDVMPPLMAQLQQAFEQMGALMQQSVQLQEQTLAAIRAPKSVQIQGAQKDAAGNIIGAQVVSTPQLPQVH